LQRSTQSSSEHSKHHYTPSASSRPPLPNFGSQMHTPGGHAPSFMYSSHHHPSPVSMNNYHSDSARPHSSTLHSDGFPSTPTTGSSTTPTTTTTHTTSTAANSTKCSHEHELTMIQTSLGQLKEMLRSEIEERKQFQHQMLTILQTLLNERLAANASPHSRGF
jgi:hypothetical protein